MTDYDFDFEGTDDTGRRITGRISRHEYGPSWDGPSAGAIGEIGRRRQLRWAKIQLGFCAGLILVCVIAASYVGVTWWSDAVAQRRPADRPPLWTLPIPVLILFIPLCIIWFPAWLGARDAYRDLKLG